MGQFAQTHSDRSELGMSNASSVGLPGMGTLKAGIAFADPLQRAQFEQLKRESEQQ